MIYIFSLFSKQAHLHQRCEHDVNNAYEYDITALTPKEMINVKEYRENSNRTDTKQNSKNRTKKIALIAMMAVLVISIVLMATVIVGADTYYTLRINYVFEDGTPAHDPYVATYPANGSVNLTVTNPEISGYTPMTAAEDGLSAATTEFNIASLSENQNVTVYYLAGLSHFRVMYYKQNLYDDMYTRDNTLPSDKVDRYGYTGTNPTYLEDEVFEGFTNLFHEPDAIAADGSTVFRVYYDRNYYTILFDLGSNGYGTEPVYAKYESVYHVKEPKRMGYTFEGWLLTDKDSSKLTYKYSDEADGKDEKDLWTFIDENGNELVDGSDNPLFDEHGDPIDTNLDVSQYYIPFFPQSTIPAHDVFYKAAWAKGTTSYSVVYWLENADSTGLHMDDIDATQTIDEARALISSHYSVIGAYDVENVASGTEINLDTEFRNSNGDLMKIRYFFGGKEGNTTYSAFNLNDQASVDANGNPKDSKGKYIDFPSMSAALRSELKDKVKYYELNEDMSALQFTGKYEIPHHSTIEVMGDGTTRINVYLDRKDFVLKFFYARQNYNNGQLTDTYSLTNSTKNFSKENYYGGNRSYLTALNKGSWQSGIAETLPHIKDEYLKENGGILEEKYVDYSENGALKYRYYYYEIHARYNEPLRGKWLIDAITPVHKKNFAAAEMCEPGSWATEYGTNFMLNNIRGTSPEASDNFTVKGIYETLGDELMFRNRTEDYTTLMFLLSWTNTDPSGGWNYGYKRILHFTYENYIELLPREIEQAEYAENGYQSLVDNGTYLDVIERTFTDLQGNSVTRAYGLTADNRILTTDSGEQYDRPKYSLATITANVRTNQVAASITGCELENYQQDGTGKAKLNDNNTIVDWDGDSNEYRKCTIKFFYNRKEYSLKWRNGNRLEDLRTRTVKFGASLNSVYTHEDGAHLAGEYRYWYNGDPIYFNADLRDYYNFEGWYDTPYYYREVDKDTLTMPADDMTLYAKWEPKIINVSFYPTYNDYYEGINRIGDEIPVHYGSYIDMRNIPADVADDPNNLRPDLVPPTSGAMFAGWYYLRDNMPHRFDPENIPVTALNGESSAAENATLRLFAEWATRDAGKYKVTYVEKDHPEIEVADPTIGRAFVWKTKTFNAKGFEELNEAHAWNENGINWWPTTNSHSINIRSNSVNYEDEYEPNVYAFEYVQKHGVYYRVQYLDASSRTPLLDPVELGKSEIYTTDGAVKEDAPFIVGYNAESLSQTLVLTASTAETAEEQKADELETNVITFYYNKNDRDYIYEVEYWEQDANDDDYTLMQTETLQVEIAEVPNPTLVSLSEVYNGSMSSLIISTGFTRVEGATKVAVTSQDGTSTETLVPDNASVTITGDAKTTIKIYYNRNTYPYSYQYVDYHAERAYLDTPEAERGDMWNGVLETHEGDREEKVDATISIPTPQDLTYINADNEEIPYTRIGSDEVTLTIGPTEIDPTANFFKVYYRKFNVRELQYKVVCKNEDDEFTYVDYNPVTGDPLFGGLSLTMQTVDAYNKINDVIFYDFNEAMVTNASGVDEDLHMHHYNFLGWYDNPEGTGEPLKPAITNPDDPNYNSQFTLTKADLGLTEGELPERDTTYYAVVEQVLVHGDFEFRYVEEALPVGGDSGETAEDIQAAAIVAAAPIDADGSRNGCYFLFSNPRYYQSSDPLPYDKHEGYTVSITEKENDDRVYKYEFAEWWEEDLDSPYDETLQTHKLIRKKTWNQWGEWGAPTTLEDQSDRREDKHIIAVYKRRNVTELPYTINYQFIDRFGNLQTFVKKGVLNADQLDEKSANCAITSDGDFRLTDEFILENAPYETNYGETLRWSNRDGAITKTSVKEGTVIKEGDTPTTEDRVFATITAVQNAKAVHAHYRLTPTGAYTQDLQTFYAANYNLDPNMKSIEAPASYNGHPFKYWAVRKSGSDTAPIVAKSLTKLFDLCMMDNYWLSPVYDESAAASGSGSNTVVLVNALPSSGGEDWLAWTWDTSDDGEWVRPDGMTFSGLKTYVIFVRVPAGTAYSAIDWDSNVWNRTEDLTVQGGSTFTLKWYADNGSNNMYGEWGDTPVTSGDDPQEETTEAASVNLTFLDYTRNRWTDEDGNIASSGETDLLFADFEIAFEDNGNQIYQSDDYKTGVILEYCTTVPDYATFDPTRNYGQTTNYDNLAAALTSRLAGENVTQYSYKTGKNRTIQFCEIPTTDLTDHNRVEFGKYIKNAFTVSGTDEEPVYTYKNCSYLLKATAYLVDGDGNVTFSKEPVYVCYKNIASQNSAVPTLIENTSGN